MQLQIQHDTLPEDDTEFVPDGDILTRVQYLVATHDFLTTHGDATLADWHARQAVLLQCGHAGLCLKCAENLWRTRAPCPMCRQSIALIARLGEAVTVDGKVVVSPSLPKPTAAD